MTIYDWQNKVRKADNDSELIEATFKMLVELGEVVADLSDKLDELSETVLPGYFASPKQKEVK